MSMEPTASAPAQEPTPDVENEPESVGRSAGGRGWNLATAAALVLAALGLVWSATLNSTVSDLLTRVDQLEQQTAEGVTAQAEVIALEQQVADLTAMMTTLEAQAGPALDGASVQYRQMQDDLAAAEEAIAALNAELDVAEQDQQAVQDAQAQAQEMAAAARTSLEELIGQITENAGPALDAARAEFDQLQADVAAAEKDIADLEAKLASEDAADAETRTQVEAALVDARATLAEKQASVKGLVDDLAGKLADVQASASPSVTPTPTPTAPASNG